MTNRHEREEMIDVLIVGAGPTGLMMANLLARYGVGLKIIDKKSGPVDESRALVVHTRTLELWDKLGLADEAVEGGQQLREAYVLVEGKPPKSDLPILSLEGGKGLTPYPFALVYEQSQTERLLLEGLEEADARVEWDTELLGLTQSDDEARAVVRRPDGEDEAITAKWVVGADSAHSSVRNALSLGFEGTTYEQAFFLADVDMEWALGRDKVYLDLFREGMYTFFPMYGAPRFRLLGSVTPELAGREEITLDDVQEALDKFSGLDVRITNARWTSVYRLHQRMTERFRVGRVFLAGDAAHIHSPAGGQGMNTGVQDVFNLGWKLALVARGQALPGLLDSYEAERMPVARTILRGTDWALEFESTNKSALQRLRLLAAPYLPRFMAWSRLGKIFFKLISQTWIHYRGSPAVAESGRWDAFRRGPRTGDRAPYGFLADGSSLYELLGGIGHHLLLFEGRRTGPGRVIPLKELEELLGRYHGVEVSVHRIPAEAKDLHRRYGAKNPSLFLIRPDGHIAYWGQTTDLTNLEAYLDKVFVKGEPVPTAPQAQRLRGPVTKFDTPATQVGALIASTKKGEAR